jgi:hypothetical protein
VVASRDFVPVLGLEVTCITDEGHTGDVCQEARASTYVPRSLRIPSKFVALGPPRR